MAFSAEGVRRLTLPEKDETAAWSALEGQWALERAGVGRDLESCLREYLSGKGRLEYSGPLDLGAVTPFQEAILKAMKAIPFGQVLSYAALADAADHKGAARAAGQVCAGNSLPLLIPCHRVVASDGSLGGFGGGLSLKERLLNLEGVSVKEGRVVGR